MIWSLEVWLPGIYAMSDIGNVPVGAEIVVVEFVDLILYQRSEKILAAT